ncbi:TonB-dependent receptor [Niveibacterium sp. 24ML]|uniref:TonB-dependent receptor n=1 Tax=Niveibacterium sp. 24ML TaxID=2985512 RepID=UPI00226F5490|nr:TonB-dependent receptor [Niveibacterium sp. 24ML]MCX9157173.1 TonB-dependent receptor [Niveibacterium sp. 24ML]
MALALRPAYRALLQAFGTTVAFGMLLQPAVAQEQTDKVQKIQVTGSSIKRIAKEGALPVQTLTQDAIAKTGATTASELLQQLPVMQGFTTSADSVGGGGGGVQTASIHDIGEQYTLVLLNGRRVAPSGSGSVIDLNSIPMAAIERVEVLTDGASAIYGSDAIAGVVNFIMKKEYQGFALNGQYRAPEQAGGDSWSAGFTAGFGNLDEDRYSVLMSYQHDSQQQLAAKDRKFAKTGMIGFHGSGQVNGAPYTGPLYFFNGSGNAIPGGASVTWVPNPADIDPVTGKPKTRSRTFNPYLLANGECADNNSQIGNNCFFDYTSTIEIQPATERDSVFATGRFKITENLTAFADLAYTNFQMTSRIAPYPTGFFPLDPNSALVATYVKPYLTPAQLAGLTSVSARWRALPAGNRVTEYDTTANQMTVGLEGSAWGWDGAASYTYSTNETQQDYPDGWLLADFATKAYSGGLNVFGLPSDLTDSDKAVLASATYHGPWDNQKTTMNAFETRASRPIFSMGGGDALLGLGFDYRTYDYKRTVADANANEELLFLSKDDPYSLDRSSYGLFGEMLMPITKGLEVSGALRYDTIGATTSNGASLGKDESAMTYKLSGRYTPISSLLIRGSYGTGFKAPSMLDIGRPRAEFGVTSNNYSCPFGPLDPKRAWCIGDPETDKSQYNVYLEGNSELKPETSTQWTIGFVFEPVRGMNVSLDMWEVKIKDAVTSLSEAQIFGDASKYYDLFIPKRNNATGLDELAILQKSINVGQTVNRGLDYTFGYSLPLSFGRFNTQLNGTYLLESKYTRPGTSDDWTTSLGVFGENDSVSFQNVFTWAFGLTTGDFTNTITYKYRSGYDDQLQSADDCAVSVVDALGDCAEVQLSIPSYSTTDWQLAYAYSKKATVRFGITNLFDDAPPLSLRTSGAGHQVGYDPRYTDSYGRTYYLSGELKF